MPNLVLLRILLLDEMRKNPEAQKKNWRNEAHDLNDQSTELVFVLPEFENGVLLPEEDISLSDDNGQHITSSISGLTEIRLHIFISLRLTIYLSQVPATLIYLGHTGSVDAAEKLTALGHPKWLWLIPRHGVVKLNLDVFFADERDSDQSKPEVIDVGTFNAPLSQRSATCTGSSIKTPKSKPINETSRQYTRRSA